MRHPNNKLLTIREDEVASTKLTLSASPVSVSEGGGDQTVTLTATVDEGARVSGTPVRVSVSGGTAVAGTDYSAVEDFTFRIPPGRTSGTGTFTLTPIDDEADGPDKTVTVTATTPDSVGLPVEPVSGLTITIADDDGAPSGTLALTVDTIATDNTVNIAEKTAGFAISGTIGSEGGVAVSVTIGSQSPLSDTSDNNGAWSVTVPADTAYITGTSVAVSVSASKTGFTVPSDVTRTLTVDLAAPSVSYTAPASLKVDVAISAVTPTTADTDIASYSATGLPSGLTIHSGTGAISGTPDTAAANAVSVTVTVTDSAGNPADVSITFPAVDKGDQTLTGFAYSPDTVTFGDTAPTVTAPTRAQTPLAYTATPSTVCTVDSGTGALTLAGVGECVITVTAASSANYNQAKTTFTVTVRDTLALSVDAIATDDTVNIAEKTAGFAISGTTGSEAGVAVSVTIGAQSPLNATSNSNGAWSVRVPANAAYITGTSVAVAVSASKTGFAAPSPVTRTLAVDLAAPSVSYTAPASLKVGVAISAVTPTTADTDIASYSATGLPSGLTIHSGTGAISGTPDTAAANAVSVTVTVTDTAGNPADVSITFPTVDKGDQTLTGFAYSPDTVTFGDTAPTVMAPSEAQTPLAYTATPSTVCTVDAETGALTLAGVGSCVVTVTAESSANYNQETATFTVTVQDTLALSVDAIATDDTVNIAEKTAGFAISGATGSEAGVAVSVTIGSQSPLNATSNSNGAWSVRLPANAAYITGTSVAVAVSASKTGFAAPNDVTRTLTVDLAAPSVSYTAPASLKVGVAISAVTPTTTDADIASYSATGLPSGLTIHSGTGAISGTPDTASATTAAVTVTVTDTAGNPADVSITFPTVDKGDQTLTGFAYSPDTVTFGDTAPTVTAPTRAQTPLAYSATPSTVCTVDSGTGALTLAGVGSCVVTVTAESSANYNQETATFTVTVQDTLALSVDAIATDDTVNIAEKTAGFAISGTTGSEAGVAVSVTIGAQSPLNATSNSNGAWSVRVPANAAYITGTSVAVAVSASKTGFTAPNDVTRTLTVDLAAPSVSYTAPASLKVGVTISAVTPTTTDADIASYSATGLPSGLTIHSGTGAISGTPDTAAANAVSVTVTVTDSAGNPADVSITFPTVDKGDQTLTGFAYSPDTVTFGDTAPTVMAPSEAQTPLAYTATPSTVCTVDSGTGALTLAGVGSCVVTVTAESSANYNQETATFTVTVQDTLALSVDAIATDDTVNIAEKTVGFAISGTTGSEGGVSVTVTVGSMTLTATSAEADPATWSVTVPANAAYITGTSVAVAVSASKTGFAAPNDVTRTLTVDLAAPSVSYTAPASLKVGVAISAVTPTTADADIASYSATGLPSGLTIHSGTGAISGTPDTAAANTAAVTVTATDSAGNPATVSITFPTVDKGDQTLTGFAYSPDTVTFGDTAPTVTAPTRAQTPLAYSATPSTVCTVDSGTGALTLAGVGSCVVTVTAESSANYNQETATFTVTVQDTLALSVDAIATDDTVNIAEKTAGFAISGTTGSEGGVSVTVTVGSMTLTATSAEADPATWSVTVPANAAYITGTSVAVSASASKTGFTAPSPVTRTLAVDLAAPSVSYTAPASLKVGVAISAVTPTTTDADIASYSATGLPSGLTIHSGTGAISGTPDTAAANTAAVTVTATDSAGNPADVSITFPTVDKGDQTLTGFAYSPDTVTFGDTAPTVTAPTRAQTTLAYTATPSTVCTVDSGTGALTLAGVGSCVVTVTAESSANYNQETATFTVTVQDTLALSVDAIATDDTVNIAEKTAGFAISGTTGSEGGVSVTVAVGSMTLTATSTEADPATWSVTVPANAAYITGTSVNVSVSASKTGFAAPNDVTRTLAVDLAAPSVSYTAPASLKVGVAISAVTPTTTDADIASYSATGLPSGLTIHSGTGAISGTPDTAAANAAAVTVTVTDSAGNPTTVSLAFPAVDKGDQTLTGFAYSPDTVTFGDTAPTVTAPTRAQTPLAYTATPSTVCTVDSGTGALTLAGVGSCVVTVTAESSANYNQETATFTVTVQDTLALSVDAIATDNTVNIAEKTAGFAISGTTGSEGGVSVTVTVGSMTLTATSAEADPATWSVTVPANAAYITGTSVNVSVSASKTGFAAPSPVTRTLAVDLAAPSVSYTAPASLKVDVTISAVTPTTTDADIASYSATGLPSGLTIHSGTGAISGTPDTAAANAVSVTVTVTDSAGNPADVSITFPTVDKGDQTLTGFAYSPDTVTFGDTAPTVMAPSEAQTPLAYTATPSTVCTVDSGTGALTLAGVGSCVVTVTAESSANYNQETATFTVTVQDTLALSVDAIATDDTVNIAERRVGEHRREDRGVRNLGHHRLGGGGGGQRHHRCAVAAERDLQQQRRLVGEGARQRRLHHRHQRGGGGVGLEDRLHRAERCDAHLDRGPRRALGELHRAGVAQGGT